MRRLADLREIHLPVLACLLALGVVTEIQAQDEWTRFRGPDGRGIAGATDLPVSFDESDYLWNVELPGRGHSSPVLWGDKMFLTCERQQENTRSVICLDATDGGLLWSFDDTFETFRNHKFNSYATSTPAVDADRVYVSWVSGKTFVVLALDHHGKQVWQRRMGDFEARFGAGASPIVIDGLVIMGNDHAGETSFLIGLDAPTGQTRWKVPRTSGMASYITPSVYRPSSGPPEVVFVSPSHGFTGLDPATGKVNWELGGLFTKKTVACPTIAGDLIFATGGQGGRGVESATVRRGDAPTGRKPEVAYTIESGLPYVPTPVVFEDHIYIWTDGGTVTCVEAATGKQVWQEEVGNQYFSSPICVAGRLYCVSKKGEVVALDASPSFKPPARSQLPEGSYATPAVANGRLYFRTFNRVICVGPEKGK